MSSKEISRDHGTWSPYEIAFQILIVAVSLSYGIYIVCFKNRTLVREYSLR